MEGWRQQTITKHPDTRGSFASGIRPQHRPWGAPHRSLGISFISAPCVQEKRERCPTKAVPRQAPRRCTGSPLISVDSLRPVSALITHIPWGAVHRSLGISVYPPDITYPEEVWAPVVVAVESA